MKLNGVQLTALGGLGDRGSCHAFGSAEEHRQEFSKAADRAKANTNELVPLLNQDASRAAAEDIRAAIGDGGKVLEDICRTWSWRLRGWTRPGDGSHAAAAGSGE